MSAYQPVQILMVEDSPTDALLTREALSESKCISFLDHVTDGVEAMKYLRHQEEYQQSKRPDLILLDLNLPRKDGREVLAEIKSDAELRRIPVIVLTTSEADTDVLAAYDHHANCYIVKPVNFQKFVHVVQQIENFWFALVTLPRE